MCLGSTEPSASRAQQEDAHAPFAFVFCFSHFNYKVIYSNVRPPASFTMEVSQVGRRKGSLEHLFFFGNFSRAPYKCVRGSPCHPEGSRMHQPHHRISLRFKNRRANTWGMHHEEKKQWKKEDLVLILVLGRCCQIAKVRFLCFEVSLPIAPGGTSPRSRAVQLQKGTRLLHPTSRVYPVSLNTTPWLLERAVNYGEYIIIN